MRAISLGWAVNMMTQKKIRFTSEKQTQADINCTGIVLRRRIIRTIKAEANAVKNLTSAGNL
jgi:hypothetical protein